MRAGYLSIIFLLVAGCGKNEAEPPRHPFMGNNEKALVDGRIYKTDIFMLEVAGFSPNEITGQDKMFRVNLKATNLRENKKMYLPSWGVNVNDMGPDSVHSSIIDEFDNYSMAVLSDPSTGLQLIPGKTVEIDLEFMEIVPTARKLKMTLIGNKLTDGKDLVFNLELPANQTKTAD